LCFEEKEILIPKIKRLSINNRHTSKDIRVTQIFTSTSQLNVYPEGSGLPSTLKPGEKLEIKVLLAPDTAEYFEGALFVEFDDGEFVLLIYVNAWITLNQYNLEPIFISDIPVEKALYIPVKIFNPFQEKKLTIDSVYSTEKFLGITWPNKEQPGGALQNVIQPNQTRNVFSVRF